MISAKITFKEDPFNPGSYILKGESGTQSADFTYRAVCAASLGDTSYMLGESGTIYAVWIASDISDSLVSAMYDPTTNIWDDATLVHRNAAGPISAIGDGTGNQGISLFNFQTKECVVVGKCASSTTWSAPQTLGVMTNVHLTLEGTPLTLTVTGDKTVVRHAVTTISHPILMSSLCS